MREFWLLLCILNLAFCIGSCSVPNLEKPQCTEARNAVKRFYSFHLGNDMRPSSEYLTKREAFLTTELRGTVSTDGQMDYFTATDNYPKAFRVGECTSAADDRAVLQVLLFWRDDASSDQKEIKVEVAKTGDNWLVNKVHN